MHLYASERGSLLSSRCRKLVIILDSEQKLRCAQACLRRFSCPLTNVTMRAATVAGEVLVHWAHR